MTELTIGFVDDATGNLLLDEESSAAQVAAGDLSDLLGTPEGVGCATPLTVLSLTPDGRREASLARISGYWHDDFMVGPGRRSVVRFQGCPIRCAGCWVPQTWEPSGGYWIGTEQLSEALLDSSAERDGVTILGGEPFAQPIALYALVTELQLGGCRDITVYTGFTREALRARDDVYVDMVLDSINLLIDGKFIQERQHFAACGCDDETRRWSGSCNQRVLKLKSPA